MLFLTVWRCETLARILKNQPLNALVDVIIDSGQLAKLTLRYFALAMKQNVH